MEGISSRSLVPSIAIVLSWWPLNQAYFIFIRISLLEKNKSYEPNALYLLLPKWNTEMKEGILMIANCWLSELLLAAWKKEVWEHRELLFYNYPIFATVGLFRDQTLGKIPFFCSCSCWIKIHTLPHYFPKCGFSLTTSQEECGNLWCCLNLCYILGRNITLFLLPHTLFITLLKLALRFMDGSPSFAFQSTQVSTNPCWICFVNRVKGRRYFAVKM